MQSRFVFSLGLFFLSSAALWAESSWEGSERNAAGVPSFLRPEGKGASEAQGVKAPEVSGQSTWHMPGQYTGADGVSFPVGFESVLAEEGEAAPRIALNPEEMWNANWPISREDAASILNHIQDESDRVHKQRYLEKWPQHAGSLTRFPMDFGLDVSRLFQERMVAEGVMPKDAARMYKILTKRQKEGEQGIMPPIYPMKPSAGMDVPQEALDLYAQQYLGQETVALQSLMRPMPKLAPQVLRPWLEKRGLALYGGVAYPKEFVEIVEQLQGGLERPQVEDPSLMTPPRVVPAG